VRREETSASAKVGSGWALKHGAIGGAIAAVVFAMAEMTVAWITSGNFIGPMQMIAGVPLRQPPMRIDPMTAVIVGVVSHMAYSITVGIIVAFAVASVPALRASAVVTVLFATVVGFVIWPLNFYLIFPTIGAPWFANETNPLFQFIFHTFMYGSVLGLYLASRHPSDRGRVAGPPTAG